MKGLLLKDVYIIGKLCKTYFLMDILFFAAFYFGGDSDKIFWLFYPCIFSGMLPMTLISFDERERWDKYAGTLPYTRTQLVSSKYLIGLCGSIITLAVASVIWTLKMSNSGESLTGDYFEVIIALISVSLIAPAVLFPFIFRFGAEKGRIFYVAIIGAACAVSFTFNEIDTAFAVKSNDFLTCAVSFAVAAFVYSASWLLSAYFYKKREL